MSATTITVPRLALDTWLKPALACAGVDDMLPVLTYVQLDVRADHTLAVTTDRFRAGLSRLRHGENDREATPVQVLVSAADLASVLSFHRLGRSRVHKARPIDVTFDANGATFSDPAGAAVTIPSRNGTFPDIAKLIREAMVKAGSPEAVLSDVGVNFKFLSDFKVAASPRTATRISATGGPGKPLLVQPHDDFIGLLMPRRLLDNGPIPPITAGWHDALGIPDEATPDALDIPKEPAQ
jgi:hypothetical protein